MILDYTSIIWYDLNVVFPFYPNLFTGFKPDLLFSVEDTLKPQKVRKQCANPESMPLEFNTWEDRGHLEYAWFHHISTVTGKVKVFSQQ